jgi:hypothetical protein
MLINFHEEELLCSFCLAVHYSFQGYNSSVKQWVNCNFWNSSQQMQALCAVKWLRNTTKDIAYNELWISLRHLKPWFISNCRQLRFVAPLYRGLLIEGFVWYTYNRFSFSDLWIQRVRRIDLVIAAVTKVSFYEVCDIGP